MANSETTFADRLSRANALQAAIAAYTPVFAPSDETLTAAAFGTFVESIQTLNTAVATAEAASTEVIAQHNVLMKEIKELSGQINNFVKSNIAWKMYFASIKRAADAVRGYKKPKPKKPASATPEPPPPDRTTQQSYSDVDALFDKLIEAVKLIPGYTPAPASGIQITQLTALLVSYRAANSALNKRAVSLALARQARYAAYNGENGLRDKMKNIKAAAQGQYGMSSPQYSAIRGINV